MAPNPMTTDTAAVERLADEIERLLKAVPRAMLEKKLLAISPEALTTLSNERDALRGALEKIANYVIGTMSDTSALIGAIATARAALSNPPTDHGGMGDGG